MNLPDYVLEALEVLESRGHAAFVVGGAVRNLLLGREPEDYDIVTSARTDEIASLFPKSFTLGGRLQSVGVCWGQRRIDISTFKQDEKKIQPPAADALKNDLVQRDFTINSVALDHRGVLYDPYGGAQDIAARRIRCPQDRAETQFLADPLRMMRAIRLACQLDMEITPHTLAEISRLHSRIAESAAERVREELSRLLVTPVPSVGMRLLQQTGLLGIILPEIDGMAGFDQRNRRHDKDLFEHTLAAIDLTAPRLNVRLAAMLHDVGKPAVCTVDDQGVGHFYEHHMVGMKMSAQILERLRYDRQTIAVVSNLVGMHMSRFAKLRQGKLKQLVAQLGSDNLDDLWDLQRADTLASAPPFDFSELLYMEQSVYQLLAEGEPITFSDLAVGGSDLKEIGMTEGPEIGRVLRMLLDIVRDDPSKNDRAVLLKLADSIRTQEEQV